MPSLECVTKINPYSNSLFITIKLDIVRKLGLARIIKTYCYYNPDIRRNKLTKAIEEFQKRTGFTPKAVKAKRRGDFAYLTNINSALLGELLLNSMSTISLYLQNNKNWL